MIVLVVLSSLVFAWLFELDKYYAICDPMSHIMSMWDKILVFWFLVAKSVVWFLPLIAIIFCLMALNLNRISIFLLATVWVFSFSATAIDLIIYSLHGYHISDHIKWVSEALQEAPVEFFYTIWASIGTRKVFGAIFGLIVLMILVGMAFFLIRRIATKAVHRFEWLVSINCLALLTICLLMSPLAIVFVPTQFSDAILHALPLSDGHKRVLGSLVQVTHSWWEQTKAVTVGQPDPNPGTIMDSEEERFVTTIVSDTLNLTRERTEPEMVLNETNLPNIILIVIESFRPGAVGLGAMKNLDEWSKRGLRLNRHYAGCNGTLQGLVSLLSGNIALDKICQGKISFQMIRYFQRAGYRTAFITYDDSYNWGGIQDWYKSIECDVFIREGNFFLRDEVINDWPDSDSRKMRHLKYILNTSTGQPNFALVFFLSSHWPYAFPPEFEFFKLGSKFWSNFRFEDKLLRHTNRYMNTMIFLDKEIKEFVSQIDMDRNIVIITGDHGESMGEDGGFGHGSRPSEVQLRTPFIMVGPGVIPREITAATSHNDILPTLAHVVAGRNVQGLACTGRDLIADPTPADRAVVTGYRGGHSSPGILFINGNKRLVFEVEENSKKSETPKFIGTVDQTGQFIVKVKGSL